jgi:hypothetical protein
MTSPTRRQLIAYGSVAGATLAAAMPAQAQATLPSAPIVFATLDELRANAQSMPDGTTAWITRADAESELGGGLFRYVIGETGTLDDGGTAIADTAGGSWQRIADGPVRAEWFGTLGLQRAHDAAARAGLDLVLGPQAFVVEGDQNLAQGRTYVFAPGASITVAAGASLIIAGKVEAGPTRIFTGPGRVIGVRDVLPEWWGAVGNGLDDHADALQAALDCIAESRDSDGREQILRLSGSYRIGRTLSAPASADCNLRISGGGTVFGGARLTAAKEFIGEAALHVRGRPENDLSAISDWGLSDFAVVAESGSSCRVGIKIGDGDKSLIGLQKSRVQNVHTGGFAECWSITNARLIRFENCSGWADSVANGIALRIGLESVDFTGDIEFDACQFVAPVDSGRCVILGHQQAYDRSTGGGQLKGVYFVNCAFYKGEVYFDIDVGGGGVAGDIWLDRCQFDGFGMTQFRIAASNGAGVENVRLTNNYFRGVNEGFFAVHVDIPGDCTVRSLHVTDNWIANCNSRAILVRGVENLVLDQNSFVECWANDSIIYLENPALWQANHNALVHLEAKAPFFITLHESSSQRGTAIANAAEEGALTRGTLDDRRGDSLLELGGLSIAKGRVGVGTTQPAYGLDVRGPVGFAPGRTVDPASDGDVVFELTRDDTITLKARGRDGRVRTLAFRLE